MSCSSVQTKSAAANRKKSKLSSPQTCTDGLFLNRELTWLSFNERVLAEAGNGSNPLLERVNFLAIASANLDGFFMKRIGGLKQQICAEVRELSVDGRSPRQQLVECLTRIRSFKEQRECIWEELSQELGQQGIAIVKYCSLTAPFRRNLRTHFRESVYPLLTPQSIDPAHPFPFISNLSLNLLVSLRYHHQGHPLLARIKIPVAPDTPRLIRLGQSSKFVLLEDVVCSNLDLLFPGMEVAECALLRVIRNANSVKEAEEADDLVSMIETELQERRFAPIVRLEIGHPIPSLLKSQLADELEIDEETDAFETSSMLGMSDLKELLQLEIPALRFPTHHVIDHPLLPAGHSIFQMIRESGSVLLQHPFESFSTSVERFLREAATDPNVRAIKMTLYRTTPESSIIDALLQAAHNGKQVAVMVELKARFDEADNIRLSETMNSAGIHVSYGVVGLKTYCKAILVVRQDIDELRRYVHIGTGNYHPLKSRYYCDLGIFSTDNALGQDVSELFNFLTTGFNSRRAYQKLLVAPNFLKKAILTKIEREALLHTAENKSHIRFKMNALEDPDIVRALYDASSAGVKIELIIRDSCRLRPGQVGLSENIRVVSVVGRFVEHSRIYYFHNGGLEEYFIGSADAMKRNLETRVELLSPVESPRLQRELREILDIYLNDNCSAWDMHPDGNYMKRLPEEGSPARGSQHLLGKLSEKKAGSLHQQTRKKILPLFSKQDFPDGSGMSAND